MAKSNYDSFYSFRGQWLDYLVTRRDLTHGDFRVAYFIASKINPIDECMWWSVSAIAEEMGMSVATVSSAIRSLDDANLITIVKGRNGSNRYSMYMPIDPSGSAYAKRPERKKKTGGRKPRVSKTETSRVSKNET